MSLRVGDPSAHHTKPVESGESWKGSFRLQNEICTVIPPLSRTLGCVWPGFLDNYEFMPAFIVTISVEVFLKYVL